MNVGRRLQHHRVIVDGLRMETLLPDLVLAPGLMAGAFRSEEVDGQGACTRSLNTRRHPERSFAVGAGGGETP